MPQFGPRPREQRKRKVRDRLRQPQAPPAVNWHHTEATTPADSNASAILPTSTATREARKAAIREELRATGSKVSGKKQKRLDKYIENKLKKDESSEYLKLLEKEHEGWGKRTFGEYVRGQIEVKKGKELEGKRRRIGLEKGEDGDAGESEDSLEDEAEPVLEKNLNYDSETGSNTVKVARPAPAHTGSGLANPLQIGVDGLPIMEQEKSHKKRRRKASPVLEEDEAWEGFSDQDEEAPELSRAEKERLVMQLLNDESSSDDFENDYGTEGEEGDEIDDESTGAEDHSDSMTNEGSKTLPTSGNENGNGMSLQKAEDLIMAFMKHPPSDEDACSEKDADSSSEGHWTDATDDSSDGQSEGSTTSNTSFEEDTRLKPRTSAFRTWATQQLNHSLGHIPSYDLQQGDRVAQVPTDTKVEVVNPILKEVLPAPKSTRRAYAIHVERNEELQQARSELPILRREQEIMEAIHNHPVVIVKGDTGSGKTTQVPQFLYEAGYGSPEGPTPGMIGITQPRRVAAVSMAKRVGDELGDHGHKVGYQIRFDSNVSNGTAVKFMTDGILMRELSHDLLLRRYSVIVIDEAHERSVNTDILIGMLSKIIPARMRKSQFNPNPVPLKLVVMSATLNIGDFVNDRLFPLGSKPPIVEAEGRQHRVTTHFALRSRADYVDEVVEKVRRAHRKLPRGGILVFLTGQVEIRQVAERLQNLLAPRKSGRTIEEHANVRIAASDTPVEVEDMDFTVPKGTDQQDDFDHDIIAELEDEEAADEFDISDDEGETANATTSPSRDIAPKQIGGEPYTNVHILPLYSQLQTALQLRVFEPPPEGARPIILATNVAETSLTIPGIRYVFDTGRSKERKYNLDSGVQSFEIDYISKASAAQRAGRAGRTGPGHCWRLYSSAVYEQFFPEHTLPEILRAPAENIVLQLKSFAYAKPVIQFPFPSAPDLPTLNKAETLLKNLGALTSAGSITALGKELSLYPLSPQLGKIISQGVAASVLLPSVLMLVAGLAVQEVFVQEPQLDASVDDYQNEEMRNDRKQAFGRARANLSKHDKSSDAMKLYTAVSVCLSAVDKDAICRDYFLRPKAMFEVTQLYGQLNSIVRANNPALLDVSKTGRLSSKHIKQLNSIAASGYINQVAIRADLSPNPPEITNKPRRAIDVPYLPLRPLTDRATALLADRAIFVHPSSVLSRASTKDLPRYIVYSHLQRSQPHSAGTDAAVKTRMFPLTPVDGKQLVELAKDTALLVYGKPLPNTKLEEIAGSPKRRECWITTELRSGPGFGWPLPPTKVRQVLDIKSPTGWRVESFIS